MENMSIKEQNDFQITIRMATKADITTIDQVMTTVHKGVEDPNRFFADDLGFIQDHIDRKGFTLLAQCDGKTAGFLMIRFSGNEEDNLIKNIPASMHITEDNADKVAHFESAAVLTEFRGRKIQQLLMEEAIKKLEETPYQYYMATVHPDNPASFKSLQKCGFKVINTVEKYGGLKRNVLFRMK